MKVKFTMHKGRFIDYDQTTIIDEGNDQAGSIEEQLQDYINGCLTNQINFSVEYILQ